MLRRMLVRPQRNLQQAQSAARHEKECARRRGASCCAKITAGADIAVRYYDDYDVYGAQRYVARGAAAQRCAARSCSAMR